jgi:hypothetical protein
MKKFYTIPFILIAALLYGSQSIRASQDYNFSFKNKSPRPVQIEIMQQLTPITKLIAVSAGDMFTTSINTKEVTRMYIYYCPDTTWCKTLKPERMTATFTPHKPIHITFDGKTVRPQLKRFKNVGSSDIKVIKTAQ